MPEKPQKDRSDLFAEFFCFAGGIYVVHIPLVLVHNHCDVTCCCDCHRPKETPTKKPRALVCLQRCVKILEPAFTCLAGQGYQPNGKGAKFRFHARSDTSFAPIGKGLGRRGVRADNPC